jgi:hypothetical protein
MGAPSSRILPAHVVPKETDQDQGISYQLVSQVSALGSDSRSILPQYPRYGKQANRHKPK